MLATLKALVPYALRIELARARRWPAWWLERPALAPRFEPARERADYGEVLAQHGSPLRRSHVRDEALQRGKEQNVRRAVALLDGLRLGTGECFSYHHAIGRPSRRRGFADGLELRDGALSRGVGGGCCQVSNLLYWLALCGGMKVLERHRHALDLFPDEGRAVPFGCGATVFYNYADLRFENPLGAPVLLSLAVREGRLEGALRCTRAMPWRVEVQQTQHRFVQRADGWHRENTVRRRFVRPDGSVLRDELVAHNAGRVLYTPSEAECSAR